MGKLLLLAASLPLTFCALSSVRPNNNETAGARAAGVVIAKAPARVAPPRSTTSRSATTPRRLAKYEPVRGAYLGAALSFDGVASARSRSEHMAAAMRGWERQAGRKHAIYVQFLPFPHSDGRFPGWTSDPQGWPTSSDFATATAAAGATPMITLEPLKPHDFARAWRPGSAAYQATQRYATAAGKWGKPLFIRFAHEMNGSWYPWAEWIDKNRNLKRDPDEETGFTAADYRKAYRNVALMFRRHAPNVALIWCPNSGLLGGGRRDVFRPWYPGDDVVDWVGLDVYERGWSMPGAGSKLWGGQFAQNLTHDMADDASTQVNDSVNFYRTFAQGKKKPMMICETGATLSFRTDLNLQERSILNNKWKTGYWNSSEYGWMQGVYGTTHYKDQTLLHPIDKSFPLIKGIVWFQIAKNEDVVAQASDGKLIWFENAYTDYRIGGGAEKNAPGSYNSSELALYRRLTGNPYFLTTVRR
jgi:hypothetical protein